MVVLGDIEMMLNKLEVLIASVVDDDDVPFEGCNKLVPSRFPDRVPNDNYFDRNLID